MCFSCFTGLFWYCEESHWLVYHQAQAGYGSIPGAVAVCGRCVAHVQQCLVVQPQNIPRLQVLHQAGRSVWSRDRSRHAGLGLLLRQEGETRWEFNTKLCLLCPSSPFTLPLPEYGCRRECNLFATMTWRSTFSPMCPQYEFSPQTLCCYGKQLCTISRDGTYYSYQNR